LKLGDFKSLPTADISAGHKIVATHHVGLRFGEPGPIPLVGVSGQLRSFPPNYPVDLMFTRLAAMRANQRVRLLLIGFGKKIAFFHHWAHSNYLPVPKYSILGSAMTKRKIEKFSVTKAVKSNARDQVGQPKPSRVIEERPKTEGRQSKHKPNLEDLIESSEE